MLGEPNHSLARVQALDMAVAESSGSCPIVGPLRPKPCARRTDDQRDWQPTEDHVVCISASPSSLFEPPVALGLHRQLYSKSLR